MDTSLRWSGGEIDLRQRCVRTQGQTLQPNARAFDLLVALAQARGQVVAKSALLDHVWPDQAVEESNLAVHVHALRRLLGHEAVATVPGRGYRLGLPLDDAAAPPPAPSSTATAAPPDTLPPDPGADLLDRAAALQTLVGALERGERLVELVGVGGAGKSTLALAAAHRLHAGGVRLAWLELATISDEAALPGAIARSAGLALHVDDQPARSLALALRDARLRLVLDGAEHLIEAVARLCTALLPACPGLQVLLTTQVPLPGVPTLRLPVGGLTMPADDTPLEAARACGAVALFEACGRLARRGFRVDAGNLPAVQEICRRCDGLPYAIELMAANLAMFSPSALAERLRANLPLGRASLADAPARHQSVKDAMAFTHALLPEREQVLFRRLSVFPASFSAAMAAAVCSDEALPAHEVADALATLVERCIVVLEPNAPGLEERYRLLDTGRLFALERIKSSGDEEAVADRLVEAMLVFTRSVRSRACRLELSICLREYGQEFSNLVAALTAACRRGPSAKGIELIAFGDFLFVCNERKYEQSAWCTLLEPVLDSLAHATDATVQEAVARFCCSASSCLYITMDRRAATGFRRRAIDLLRRNSSSQQLHFQLSCAAYYPDFPLRERQACLQEALAIERSAWTFERLIRLATEAALLGQSCRFAEAAERAKKALDAAKVEAPALTHDLQIEASFSHLLAGQDQMALAFGEAALAAAPQTLGTTRSDALSIVFACHVAAGRTAAARALGAEWELCLRACGWSNYEMNVLLMLPLLCAHERRWLDAARLLAHAKELWQRSGLPMDDRMPRFFFSQTVLEGIDTELDDLTRQRCWQHGQNLHPQQAFDMMLRGTNAVIPAHLVEAEALADGGMPPWPLLNS